MSNVKMGKIPFAESRRVSWLGLTSMSKVTASKAFKIIYIMKSDRTG
jgi:hypothetical protein